MGAAEQIVTTGEVPLSWTSIREQYPDRWVCVADVEYASDGSILSGRVVSHDRSMRLLLEQLDGSQPDLMVAHTARRSLRPPRLEMTDEIRDLIRARR